MHICLTIKEFSWNYWSGWKISPWPRETLRALPAKAKYSITDHFHFCHSHPSATHCKANVSGLERPLTHNYRKFFYKPCVKFHSDYYVKKNIDMCSVIKNWSMSGTLCWIIGINLRHQLDTLVFSQSTRLREKSEIFSMFIYIKLLLRRRDLYVWLREKNEIGKYFQLFLNLQCNRKVARCSFI